MSPRIQRAQRLLAALEELASQESVLVRSLDLVEAMQIGERAAPLVEEVCALATEADVAELRPQIEALVARRQRSAELLEVQLGRVQEELRRVDEARRRLTRTAPAYQRGTTGDAPSAPRLNTAA